MSMQYFDTSPARIGKLAGEIIGHAMWTEVLTPAIDQKEMPKNKSDTVIFRSWVPYGGTVSNPNTFFAANNAQGVQLSGDNFATSHITQEGVTPAADTIVPRDVTMILNQYMALYALTDKDYDLYEDDIPEAMKEQTGERMGLVREMAIYGQMKNCTNRFYAGLSGGSAVTTRAGVNLPVQERWVSKVARSLQANHAKQITKILSPSQNFGTTPVEAAYVCYVHTDAEYDIRRLPGFREVAAYGTRTPISEYELGTWQRIRFIVSPELQPILAGGSSVGTTGLQSVGGSNIDIYPFIFLSKSAFAQVKLRGAAAVDPIWLPPGQKDKNDPGGQRGYIGAKFWHTCGVLNQGWIAVLEAGVSAL